MRPPPTARPRARDSASASPRAAPNCLARPSGLVPLPSRDGCRPSSPSTGTSGAPTPQVGK
eukprot:8668338-Alexandrium_andersonii.AAC.1